MKNIHVLPTEKPSNLLLCIKSYTEHKDTPAENSDNKGNFRLGFGIYSNTEFYQHQNIYITSDEDIKVDEYYLGDDNQIYCLVSKVNCNGKKIILTTDQDLIKDGIQAIDDEFLEWFVKNPSCEYVEIKKGSYNLSPMEERLEKEYVPKGTFDTYKIIIPQEEPKQDRTCTNNCSVVCGECQILEPKPLLSVEWLLRYIEDLNNKGYTFIPSSNKEIVEHIKQMEKDNMIAFLKFVFQQDGFDYEQAYNNFLKQQIL
jgi:hypothetical protein